jgi:hypothetical protein
MKIIVLLIFPFVIGKSAFGQSDTYKKYSENGWKVFSSLDSNYWYYLKELDIKTLTEWRYEFDTTETIIDSVICNYIQFDSLGRLIEKRYDYRFKSSKFKSVKYVYRNGKISDTLQETPFPKGDILSGTYVSSKMQQNCVYRNESAQIDRIIVRQRVDEKINKLKFHYHSDLFVKYFYYREYLISRIEYFEGYYLKYRHLIDYEIRK